jgi:hypothetical protein
MVVVASFLGLGVGFEAGAGVLVADRPLASCLPHL